MSQYLYDKMREHRFKFTDLCANIERDIFHHIEFVGFTRKTVSPIGGTELEQLALDMIKQGCWMIDTMTNKKGHTDSMLNQLHPTLKKTAKRNVLASDNQKQITW